MKPGTIDSHVWLQIKLEALNNANMPCYAITEANWVCACQPVYWSNLVIKPFLISNKTKYDEADIPSAIVRIFVEKGNLNEHIRTYLNQNGMFIQMAQYLERVKYIETERDLFTKIRDVASGSFGNVMIARYRNEEYEYALKVIKMKGISKLFDKKRVMSGSMDRAVR